MSTNGYPFLSKRQILERVASDPSFVVECVAILEDRYQRRASGPGDSMGWMASHAAKASSLAAKIAAGDATEKERNEIAKLVARYTKQLARVFRDRDLAARPELSAQAAVFGVAPVQSKDAPAALPVAGEPAPVEPLAPPAEQVPAPKRRGRPPGSKNKKPRDEPAPSRRRRSRA